MTITKIEKQRHNEKRYSVFIDGEFVFGISDVDLLFYKLETGVQISQERYDYILDNVIFTKARDKAFDYIGYKPRTQKEVISKLKEEIFSEEIIERVMEVLAKYGYVDDDKYTQEFIENRVNHKKFGKMRIKEELRERGISNGIIDEALRELSCDEVEMALGHLNKKARGNKELDPKEKKRCFDYLVRRGFSYDIIHSAFKLFMREEDED